MEWSVVESRESYVVFVFLTIDSRRLMVSSEERESEVYEISFGVDSADRFVMCKQALPKAGVYYNTPVGKPLVASL